jgi:hypothetical protein
MNICDEIKKSIAKSISELPYEDDLQHVKSAFDETTIHKVLPNGGKGKDVETVKHILIMMQEGSGVDYPSLFEFLQGKLGNGYRWDEENLCYTMNT